MADVRLPSAKPDAQGRYAGGVRPVVVFLHGGFWRVAYDRAHAAPLADALAASGYIVCTPEYRKVGQSGGGWPGTFDDVAAAVRLLPGLIAAASAIWLPATDRAWAMALPQT